MKLLGLDLETTGLDTKDDFIIEIGYVLWDSDSQSPLVLRNDLVSSTSHPEKYEPIITQLTGITPEHVTEYGVSAFDALSDFNAFCELHKPDYLVGHNLRNFDKPFLLEQMRYFNVEDRAVKDLEVLDTRYDIEFPPHIGTRKLAYLGPEHGFLNPFSHRALFDVMSCLQLLSNYNIDEVIAYSKIPSVVVRGVVEYEDRGKAKEKRFQWQEAAYKAYPGWWVKEVKETEVESLKKQCDFEVVIVTTKE